jgi:hypothetical protein
MQLEYVRRLRAKGYNDLALEHLEKLKSEPTLVAKLPLERARTMLALARDKEPEQRPALFAAARAELETFVKNNPTGPDGAQGRLELARLAAHQGRALLTQAQRDEDMAIGRRAEQQFIQAGQQLDVAIKLLGELSVNYQNPDKEKAAEIKKQLVQDLLQARFDRAANFMDQADTYIDTSSDVDNRKRAEAVDQAKQAFKLIATDGGPVGLLASAWLVKVNQEGQDPTEAERHRRRIMEQTDSAAVPAQRLAKLFYLQGVMKNPTIKADTLKKYKLIEEEAKKWLAAYPTQQKTPEGWAVRFELAQAMYLDAMSLSKDPKAPPGVIAMGILNSAQKQLGAIAGSDSSLAEKARGLYITISIMKMGDKTAVADLKDFENCYLKAQVEKFKAKKVASELATAAPKDQEKLEAERKRHLHEFVKAIARANTLADTKTPPHDLDDARFELGVAYFMWGDAFRAAVAWEALARAKPATKHSPHAAAYAIDTYAHILERDNADSNRQHLKDLAEYVLSPEMQKTWAGEQVTPIARYHLAMLHDRDNHFKAAVAQLEKLPPDYAGYIFAQGQLVFIAFKGREKADAEADKKWFLDAARRALARMPRLPADADTNTAGMYFRSQLQKAAIYNMDAVAALGQNDLTKAEQNYHELVKFVTGLHADLDKSPAKLSAETRDQLALNSEAWLKYARYGLADLDYRRGRYDQVLKATEDVVALVDKLKGDGKSPIRLKDYQATGQILGLVLRANVQKGNIDKAKQILGYLERLTGVEGGGVAETTNVLRSLIGDLQMQVRDLKKANDTAGLKATVKNFSAFIDELAKKKDRGLDLKDITFLANCYSSLEEYPKAANLYALIPPPKALNKDKLAEDEDKEVATYWFMRIQYAKALRLSAKGKEDLAKSKKILDELQNHKNGRLQIYADVEQNHIFQDAALYGLAMKGWGKIMNNPALKARLADDASLKELYFNAYYENAWCLYKYSQNEKVIAAGQEKKYLRPAANYILRLERSPNQEGWQIIGPKCRELLATEKKLRLEYEDLKRTAK